MKYLKQFLQFLFIFVFRIKKRSYFLFHIFGHFLFAEEKSLYNINNLFLII